MRISSIVGLVSALALAFLVRTACTAPPAFPGDYNVDGIVSHADYVYIADKWGTETGQADYDDYRANYGRTASLSSELPLTITSSATSNGNVQWVLSFSDVNGIHDPFAAHLSIRIDGGAGAPDILSITPGPLFMDVPGTKPSGGLGWLPVVDVDPGAGENLRPTGAHFNNSLIPEAYAALGTSLGTTFTSNTFIFLTLVTEGVQPTSLRVLGGSSSADFSEYGYKTINGSYSDYFFETDQVATFAGATEIVPEASSLLVWACLASASAAFAIANRRSRAEASA